jgi:hypothetical protein
MPPPKIEVAGVFFLLTKCQGKNPTTKMVDSSRAKVFPQMSSKWCKKLDIYISTMRKNIGNPEVHRGWFSLAGEIVI